MKFKAKLITKHKLVNHLLSCGKKNTAEKVLLKCVKLLQKLSAKNSNSVIQLAILNLLSVLRVNKFSQKKKRGQKVKETPSFVSSEKNRLSKAIIKLVLLFSDKKKTGQFFYKSLTNEILLNSQSKGSAVEFKSEFQKTAIGKNNLLKYYQK
jgi:ribosomal protein S7